ncbi:FecR family protein [Dongia rigui]|uniref:FecR family protein n=2 Tax=Dongia rigui TaxID=940149 RepID=A0ABU5E0L7_9PROT|nr:FecR family protein [Dongia rigui]
MMFLRDLAWGAVALLASTAMAWADPVAQVVRLSGTATVTRDNATAQLKLGAALETGDRLATDATGRVRLQLIDGSVINLGSLANFEIAEVESGGPGTERQVGLELLTGALRAFAAPATPSSRFEIRTPRAITAVRGTEWGVIAMPAQSDVLVMSGRVGVRKNEISGRSAISLTRTLGVTVTDTGLGAITRWPKAQVEAWQAATDVPGADVPFDLGAAPALDLLPQAPQTPQQNPSQPPRKRTSRCFDPDTSLCDKDGNGGRDNDRDHDNSHDHDSDHDHDHDSNNS